MNASFFTGHLHFVHVRLDVNVFPEDSHKGVAIAGRLGAVLRRKDVCSDDISVITPDNAANMKKAVGLMDLNFRGWYAHTLQRCVQYGIGNAGSPADNDPINTVVAMIAKCKKLVAYANNSTKVHRKLKQAARKHGTSNYTRKHVCYSSVQSFNCFFALLEVAWFGSWFGRLLPLIGRSWALPLARCDMPAAGSTGRKRLRSCLHSSLTGFFIHTFVALLEVAWFEHSVVRSLLH